MLKVIDRFTTRDGSWEPSDKPFSITPIAAAKYGSAPGKGASTHIFVFAPVAGKVTFMTSDGQNVTEKPIPSHGWVDMPMYHSSSYNPDRGDVGPWVVLVDGQKVAEGIGLPYSWHVSTFLIVDIVDAHTPPPPPPPTRDKIQLIVNGKVVWSNE